LITPSSRAAARRSSRFDIFVTLCFLLRRFRTVEPAQTFLRPIPVPPQHVPRAVRADALSDEERMASDEVRVVCALPSHAALRSSPLVSYCLAARPISP